MRTVFVVQHSYEVEQVDKTKFIGVYSTKVDAEWAIQRLRKQPGFIEWPDGFHVTEYELNKDHWAEGFATITPIQVKNGEVYVTVHAERLLDGTFKIIENYYEDDSSHEFRGNDIVKCEEKIIDGSIDIFAVELVRRAL